METEQSTEEILFWNTLQVNTAGIFVYQKPDDEKFSLKDPKDSDLFLIYMKSRETLMEVYRRSDVQIDAVSSAKGRKTNRTNK